MVDGKIRGDAAWRKKDELKIGGTLSSGEEVDEHRRTTTRRRDSNLENG